ncbi:phospholipid scramblase-related protein [Saccharopolyspora pogona]|uniref:phospholipid scramblase-related protein n=1 Tax=Saccharopolyspora pogona TaxID=333966 RepID=UPI0016829882|nr:phospholipid scramblase-related protein [Saccharopolyspora pogona]
MNAPPPPGWYPDQTDQRYVRWWDGRQWTQHVQPAQQQYAQQHPAAQQNDASAIELAMGGTGDAASIQHQVQQRAAVGGAVAGGGGTLFTEPVLVINQKAKLIEVANEYAVYDQHGRQLGSVMQVGQSGAQKALRMLTKLDSLMTVTLEIRDITGRPVLVLTRPATMWKGTVHVQRPNQSPVGDIKLTNVWGKARFDFEVNGQRIGSLHAENLRAWDIKVFDHADAEIGRITKTWQGLAKAAFTTADNYVLQIHRPLADPLLSMVVASALTVDTILSQNQR